MPTINAAKMNLAERRALLDTSKGRVFNISFKKKDKSIGEYTVKTWMEKSLTYGKDDVKANPIAHKPEYYTSVEVSSGKWKNVNLSNLVKATINGTTYVFEGDE